MRQLIPSQALEQYPKERKPSFLRLLDGGPVDSSGAPPAAALRTLERELEYMETRLTTRLCRLTHDRQVLLEGEQVKLEDETMGEGGEGPRSPLPMPATPPPPTTAGPAIPYDDPKPRAQIPILQFWHSLEPYFRPLTENDLAYLQSPDEEPGVYQIPPLGRHYSSVWAQEEGRPSKGTSTTPPSDPSAPTDALAVITRAEPAPSAADLTDENILSGKPTAGPLTSRLTASLIQELSPHRVWGTDPHVRAKAYKQTFATLEERMHRELLRNDLIPPDANIDWAAQEDDTVCMELRSLQAELRALHEANRARATALVPRVRDRMAYQQYMALREDLDKEIYESAVKRGTAKGKKKKASSYGAPAPPGSVPFSPEAAALPLWRRRAFIQGLAHVFDTPAFTGGPTPLLEEEREPEADPPVDHMDTTE